MKTKNRKRQLEKAAKSKVMKYVHKHNVWINREGTCVYRKYKISGCNSALQIHTRPDRSKYLSTQIHRKILLDKVVAICFKLMPQDGNKHILIHKDYQSFDESNLEWVEESRQEYQKKRRKDMEKLTESLNPGHPNPSMKLNN